MDFDEQDTGDSDQAYPGAFGSSTDSDEDGYASTNDIICHGPDGRKGDNNQVCYYDDYGVPITATYVCLQDTPGQGHWHQTGFARGVKGDTCPDDASSSDSSSYDDSSYEDSSSDPSNYDDSNYDSSTSENAMS